MIGSGGHLQVTTGLSWGGTAIATALAVKVITWPIYLYTVCTRNVDVQLTIYMMKLILLSYDIVHVLYEMIYFFGVILTVQLRINSRMAEFAPEIAELNASILWEWNGYD